MSALNRSDESASSAASQFPWGVLGFTTAYLLPAVIGAFVTGNREFLFYIVVMLLLMAVVAVLHLRIGLSRTVLWGLSLWGLLHMAGGLLPVPRDWPISGDVRVVYSWWLVPGWLKYDQVVHAYGFGVTTLLCWEGLRSVLAGHGEPRQARVGRSVQPTVGMLTLCVAAAMGFGALNEVVEFLATILVPETNVGDYVNTGWDLVANLAGASAAAVMIWKTHRSTPHQIGQDA